VPAQLSAKEADLKRAELSASIPVTETGNVISVQASTAAATSGSLISDLPDDPHHIDANFTATEDKEIGMGVGLALSFITSIIWYIKYHNSYKNKSHDEQIEKLQTLKIESGYWQRTVKTYTQLGTNVGSGLFDVISQFFFFLPVWITLPLKAGVSALVGTILGIIAGTIAYFRESPATSSNQPSLFLLGRDDVSRYPKTGARIGLYWGTVIGGVLSLFFPFPGGIVIGMGMGAALGSVVGFILFAAIVPLINKIRFTFFPKKAETTTDKKEADSNRHPEHIFRMNYVNQGIAAGAAVGIIVGFIISLCIPVPGSTLLFIGFCGAIGATIGLIALGITGILISKAITERDRRGYSSWDYDTRAGFSLGNQNGLGIGVFGLLSACGIGLAGLKDFICSVGGLIGGLVFGACQAYQTKKRYDWPDEKFNQNKPLVPISQLLSTFGVMGGFAGSVIGFTIGFLCFGPLGGILGGMLGLGFGAVISAGIAFFCGEVIYLKYIQLSRFLAEKFVSAKQKIEAWFHVPRTEKTPVTPNLEPDEQVDFSLSSEEESVSESDSESACEPKPTPTPSPSGESPIPGDDMPKRKKDIDKVRLTKNPSAFGYATKNKIVIENPTPQQNHEPTRLTVNA